MEKIATWVGLTGGVLGLATTIGGGIVLVVAYFATREQLRVVDCYQYYGMESLSEQTNQIGLLNEYLLLNKNAAEAEIARNNDPTNPEVLSQFHEAVRLQNEKLTELRAAQKKSKGALEEQRKCGHKGPGIF